MKTSEIRFSVNRYDRDGDISETGIYLHFGDTAVKVAETVRELEEVVDVLSLIVAEIKENYS